MSRAMENTDTLGTQCTVKEIHDQASLRHARRAGMAIIGDSPDDIATWTMLIAANA